MGGAGFRAPPPTPVARFAAGTAVCGTRSWPRAAWTGACRPFARPPAGKNASRRRPAAGSPRRDGLSPAERLSPGRGRRRWQALVARIRTALKHAAAPRRRASDPSERPPPRSRSSAQAFFRHQRRPAVRDPHFGRSFTRPPACVDRPSWSPDRLAQRTARDHATSGQGRFPIAWCGFAGRARDPFEIHSAVMRDGPTALPARTGLRASGKGSARETVGVGRTDRHGRHG